MKKRCRSDNFQCIIAFLLLFAMIGCGYRRKPVPPTRQTIQTAETVSCGLYNKEFASPEEYKKAPSNIGLFFSTKEQEQLAKLLVQTTQFHTGPLPSQLHLDCKVTVYYKGMVTEMDFIPLFEYDSKSGILVDRRHEGNWCVASEEFQKAVREKIRVFRQEYAKSKKANPTN